MNWKGPKFDFTLIDKRFVLCSLKWFSIMEFVVSGVALHVLKNGTCSLIKKWRKVTIYHCLQIGCMWKFELHPTHFTTVLVKNIPWPKCLRLQNSKYFACSVSRENIFGLVASRLACSGFCQFVPFSTSKNNSLAVYKCLWCRYPWLQPQLFLKKWSRPAGIYGNLFAALRKVNYSLPLVLVYFWLNSFFLELILTCKASTACPGK